MDISVAHDPKPQCSALYKKMQEKMYKNIHWTKNKKGFRPYNHQVMQEFTPVNK